MAPDEGERLRIIEERVHPCAPRHADQIKRRALRERGGRTTCMPPSAVTGSRFFHTRWTLVSGSFVKTS